MLPRQTIRPTAGGCCASTAPGSRHARSGSLAGGDLPQIAAWKAKAVVALDGIADPDDREIIQGDIATLP